MERFSAGLAILDDVVVLDTIHIQMCSATIKQHTISLGFTAKKETCGWGFGRFAPGYLSLKFCRCRREMQRYGKLIAKYERTIVSAILKLKLIPSRTKIRCTYRWQKMWHLYEYWAKNKNKYMDAHLNDIVLRVFLQIVWIFLLILFFLICIIKSTSFDIFKSKIPNKITFIS